MGLDDDCNASIISVYGYYRTGSRCCTLVERERERADSVPNSNNIVPDALRPACIKI